MAEQATALVIAKPVSEQTVRAVEHACRPISLTVAINDKLAN